MSKPSFSIVRRKDRDGLWIRYYRSPGRRAWKRAKSDVESEAQAEGIELVNRIARRQGNWPEIPTLAEFLADHYMAAYSPTVKASTLERAVTHLTRAATYFSGLPIDQIARPACRRYLRWLAEDKGLSDGTILRERNVLAPVFEEAIECGLIQRNPLRGGGLRRIKLKRPPPREPPKTTDEDLARILDKILPKYRNVVALIIDTGLRRQQAVGLTWAEVYDDFRWIKSDLVQKGGKNRPIPLTPRAQAALREQWELRDAKSPEADRVFPGVTASGLYQHWRRLRVTLKLGGLRIHDLRHLIASSLVQLGTPLSDVAKMLGHRDARMVASVYGTMVPDEALERSVRRLADARGQTAPETRTADPEE